MTDLTPNDLSHLSDEEFNALCPQGEHAPGAEPLSPAAQAVLDAAHFVYWTYDEVHVADPAVIAAAALRIVADQFFTDWDGMCCAEHLLAIAAELEGR